MPALQQRGKDQSERQGNQRQLEQVTPSCAITLVIADSQMARTCVMKRLHEADPNGRRRRRAADMPRIRRRFEQAFKARLPHAQAKVIVFIEQEEAFVEATNTTERFRAQQQATAIQPLGAAGGVRQSIRLAWAKIVEGAAKAFLRLLILAPALGRHDTCRGIALQRIHQGQQVVRLYVAVGVEQQGKRSADLRHGLIVGFAEAAIIDAFDDSCVGQKPAGGRGCVVIAAIVDDQDMREGAQRVRERLDEHPALVSNADDRHLLNGVAVSHAGFVYTS